jgi:hypothetical protein
MQRSKSELLIASSHTHLFHHKDKTIGPEIISAYSALAAERNAPRNLFWIWNFLWKTIRNINDVIYVGFDLNNKIELSQISGFPLYGPESGGGRNPERRNSTAPFICDVDNTPSLQDFA